FTQVKGREAIFWQTQKTARAANPGARIPRRRVIPGPLTIAVDTRERYPYRFAHQDAETGRIGLPAGDYAVRAPDGSILPAVGRAPRRPPRRHASLPPARAGGPPARRGGGQSALPAALPARARRGRRARRPAPPPSSSLPRDPARLPRLPPLRRRLDLPLPR